MTCEGHPLFFLFIVFCAAAASCQNLTPTPTLACNVLNFTVVTPAEKTRNFHPATIPASAAMPLYDKSVTLAHSESISIHVNVHLPVPAESVVHIIEYTLFAPTLVVKFDDVSC